MFEFAPKCNLSIALIRSVTRELPFALVAVRIIIFISPLFLCADDQYYLYDDENDRVMDGWPRKIAEDFGPKANCSETVPNNLDAVYYDRRDKLIYFFKGKWVSIACL